MDTDQFIINMIQEKDSIQEYNNTIVNECGVFEFNLTKEDMIQIILAMPQHVKKQIVRKMSQIDFANGDMNRFMIYLMDGHICTQTESRYV